MVGVVGFTDSPMLAIGADSLDMSGRGLVSAIAHGVTDRFGSGGRQFGAAEVVRADVAITEPGTAIVTGEVSVSARPGRRLGDFDASGMVEAATTAQVGTPSSLGRITSARVISTEGSTDGRALSVLARVEITTRYTPAPVAA